MPVVLIDSNQINFDIAFRTQKHFLNSIDAFADAIFFKFQCQIDQRLSDVDDISLCKGMIGEFFLLDSLLKREVVVVGISMQDLMFDA